jgi:putative endonuclease
VRSRSYRLVPSAASADIRAVPRRPRTHCYVYVLGALTPTRHLTYVGWTSDVARRLAQHNGGTGARTTRGRKWVLLYSERCASMRHAMSREWHLKRDRAFRLKLATEKFGAVKIRMRRLTRKRSHL